MGMDVCGKKPTAKVGEYFRNKWWWWWPLWTYCETVAPRITKKVKYAHSNDGDGLNAEDSIALADILTKEIKAGRTEDYATGYMIKLAAIPDVPCDLCGGTGKRTDMEVANGCNGCSGKGTRRPFDTFYTFSVRNVKEFAAFLRKCGGFELW